MPTLSLLPFQAEGYRHAVLLITFLGWQWRRGSFRAGQGWIYDIAIALTQTCTAIHAWCYTTYDDSEGRGTAKILGVRNTSRSNGTA